MVSHLVHIIHCNLLKGQLLNTGKIWKMAMKIIVYRVCVAVGLIVFIVYIQFNCSLQIFPVDYLCNFINFI